MRKFTLGLTGGIGSGKSTVGNAFGELGVVVIDADAIAHSLTASGGAGVEPIRAEFGDAFIDQSGAMDRNRMRDHVFANPQARAALEAILHPMIRSETRRELDNAASAYVILMIPLLVEAAKHDPEHWRDRFDRILVADCSESTQLHRVMARNGYDAAAVRRIMATQADRGERLAAADDVIDNDRDLASLAAQVARLHTKYLRAAQSLRERQEHG